MNVIWERSKDEVLANDTRRAERSLGRNAARRFEKCVNAIRRARDWHTLIETRPAGMHRLEHDRAGQWAMRLSGGLRLVIEPDATYTVTIVIEITDYHRRR